MLPVTALEEVFSEKTTVVYGAGPSLPRNVDALIERGLTGDRVNVAADGATTLLLERGIMPDVIVTDLDGSLDSILHCGDEGSIVVIHAHGDNIDVLTRNVPRMRDFRLFATTQVKPTSVSYNFGGFTDGDRGVFLAEAMKAREVWLVGMDFGGILGRYSKPHLKRDTPAGPVKKKKLEFASRLVSYLSKHSRVKIRNLTHRA